MVPGSFSLKGIVFFLVFLLFLVCTQLLKGIIYPLVVQAHSNWRGHQKSMLLFGAAGASSFPLETCFHYLV